MLRIMKIIIIALKLQLIAVFLLHSGRRDFYVETQTQQLNTVGLFSETCNKVIFSEIHEILCTSRVEYKNLF